MNGVETKAIRPEELRTGNILDYFIDELLEWSETAIDWQDIKWCDEDNEGFNNCHRPIHLNEEWLVRFGADDSNNPDNNDVYGGWLLPTGEQRVRILKDDQGFYHLTSQPYGRKIRIPFVHKLQNFIYEYTGTELTLKEPVK